MDPLEVFGTVCGALALLGFMFARQAVARLPVFPRYFTWKMWIIIAYLAMDACAWLGVLTATDLFFDLRRLVVMAGMAYCIWRFNWDMRQLPPGPNPPPQAVPLK